MKRNVTFFDPVVRMYINTQLKQGHSDTEVNKVRLRLPWNLLKEFSGIVVPTMVGTTDNKLKSTST